MQTWCEIDFANGRYRAALGLEQIKEIERACGAGIGAIFARTSKGRYGFLDGEIYPEMAEYRFTELAEVIRQALIGGGSGIVDGAIVQVPDFRANELVQAYLFGINDQRMAMTRIWALAYQILHALVNGYARQKKASRRRSRRPRRKVRLRGGAHQLRHDGHPAIGGQAADMVGISGAALELERPPRSRE